MTDPTTIQWVPNEIRWVPTDFDRDMFEAANRMRDAWAESSARMLRYMAGEETAEDRRADNIARLRREQWRREEYMRAVDDLLASPMVEVPAALLDLIGVGGDDLHDDPYYRIWETR